MPRYSATLDIAQPLNEMFAFFIRPPNLLKFVPSDLHLELLEAPPLLQLGSRLVWKGRRWGISQKIVQEVTSFEQDKVIVDEQKQGPFSRWVHAHHFEAIDTGTRLREEIEFDPPGGLLGRFISVDAIRRDLDKMFAYRDSKLKELFPLGEPRT